MKCYLCGTTVQVLFRKNGHTIHRCPSCFLCMTDLGKPYDVFLKEYYDEGYFTGNVNRVAYVSYKGDRKYILRNEQKYLRFIERYKKKGRLLDVGCALGYFVQLAHRYGFDAYGCDPSPYAIQEAKNLVGSKVREGTLQSLSFPKNSFDVITMLDVFEHLHDPKKDLAEVYKLLKPGGILFIATGDTDSALARILQRRWTFYIPPQHLLFFNRSTMTIILKETGFRPVSWSCIGKWLSLRYVLHLAKTTGESKLAEWLDRVIGKTNVGNIPLYLPVHDNMIVIAEKI